MGAQVRPIIMTCGLAFLVRVACDSDRSLLAAAARCPGGTRNKANFGLVVDQFDCGGGDFWAHRARRSSCSMVQVPSLFSTKTGAA